MQRVVEVEAVARAGEAELGRDQVRRRRDDRVAADRADEDEALERLRRDVRFGQRLTQRAGAELRGGVLSRRSAATRSRSC